MHAQILIFTLAIFSSSFGHSKKFHRHSVGSHVQKQIEDGIGKFGMELHKNFAKHWYGTGENILVSPMSVYFALAMAHLGALGETRYELRDVMGLPADEGLVLKSHQVLGEMFRHLRQSEITNMSTGLFLQTGAMVKDSYREQIKRYYDSYMTNVDFTQNDATAIINRWFETRTGGKISHFYDQVISHDVKMLFANVLTLSGSWDRIFSPEFTQMETFYGDDGYEEQVNMMHKTDFLLYYIHYDDKYEVVGLPLKNGEHYIYIILPNEGMHLTEIMDNMNYESIQQIITHSSRHPVDIKMPQMSINAHEQIKDVLQAMGIHKLFDSPDLGNMLTHMNLKVAQIWHNAEWKMDEYGIDASAGTTLEYKIYDEFIPNVNVKEFYVRKPFMFFVHHPDTKSILYYGSVHRISGTDRSI